MNLNSTQKRAWLVLSLAVWAIVGLILLPPYIGLTGREIIMSAFRPLCHQLPDRSPSVNGVQLAVCHRCFGIYTGLAVAATLGAALIGFAKPLEPYARFILPLSILPLTVDWAGDFFGFWTNTPVSRTLTGAVFGTVAGVYLARAVISITAIDRRRQPNS